MRGEWLFRILGLVDADLIEEAGTASSPAAFKRRTPWRRMLAAAACLTVLAAGAGWAALGGLDFTGGGNAGSAAPGEAPPADGNAAFLSYAGPVLPLTTAEPDAALTAERAVTWDFSPTAAPDGTLRQWGAAVTDRYTLYNSTESDVTAALLYPFTGSLSELAALRPDITTDGAPVAAALVTGGYAGSFRDAGAGDGSTWNLRSPTAWTDYQALLADGGYLNQALSPDPLPDLPVTVYTFTDSTAPEDFDAATQAIALSIDETRTTILTYGFNGMEWEGGFRRYSYFVPDGRRSEPDTKMLVVLGDDIGDYTLQGYQNGACEAGNELAGVTCTVTRRTSTLTEVLDQLCGDYLEQRSAADGTSMDLLPPGLFQREAAALLVRYGLLSEDPVDRYGDGRLDDLLGEVLTMKRVLYLSFSVTVPAGGSAAVEARCWKEPSYDFGGSGTGREGLQGYDLALYLGSTLRFTAQTAALAHPEQVRLVEQTLGLDPEGGVWEAALDPAQEHCGLTIQTPEP